jgi:hypothetical protein
MKGKERKREIQSYIFQSISGVKDFYTRCLWFGMSQCKKAYIEYESQSQGIRSQPLPKRKRIAIAWQLPSGRTFVT